MWQIVSFIDTLSPFWSQTSLNPQNLTNDLLIFNSLTNHQFANNAIRQEISHVNQIKQVFFIFNLQEMLSEL